MLANQFFLRHMLFVVWGLLAQPNAAHMVWLRNENNEAIVTFGDAAGQPGPVRLQETIFNKTALQVATLVDSSSTQSLPLSMRILQEATLQDKGKGKGKGKVGGKAELVATLPTGLKTFSIEGSVDFGIFPRSNPKDPPLLKYSFSASQIDTLMDWDLVDTVQKDGSLSVTLRAYPYDTSVEPEGADTVPVAVVTKLNRQPVGGVQVKVFNATGGAIGEVTTDEKGIAYAEVPRGTFVYALAGHLEHNPGSIDGKAYNNIAHYATTSMKVLAAPLAPSEVPWWAPSTQPFPVASERQSPVATKATGGKIGGLAHFSSSAFQWGLRHGTPTIASRTLLPPRRWPLQTRLSQSSRSPLASAASSPGGIGISSVLLVGLLFCFGVRAATLCSWRDASRVGSRMPLLLA